MRDRPEPSAFACSRMTPVVVASMSPPSDWMTPFGWRTRLPALIDSPAPCASSIPLPVIVRPRAPKSRREPRQLPTAPPQLASVVQAIAGLATQPFVRLTVVLTRQGPGGGDDAWQGK